MNNQMVIGPEHTNAAEAVRDRFKSLMRAQRVSPVPLTNRYV